MGNDPKKKGSGSNGNGKGLFHGNDLQNVGEGFDWSSVEAGHITELVNVVTSRGGAIRFGYTRDGGAGSIGVYYSDQRDTVYIRPGEDFQAATDIILRTFENLPNTKGRSPEGK